MIILFIFSLIFNLIDNTFNNTFAIHFSFFPHKHLSFNCYFSRYILVLLLTDLKTLNCYSSFIILLSVGLLEKHSSYPPSQFSSTSTLRPLLFIFTDFFFNTRRL
jgi:hypothetical protein